MTRTGKAIYVISLDGLLWVSFDQSYGLIHHSSLLAGAPVLGAGEFVLEEVSCSPSLIQADITSRHLHRLM